MSLLEIKSLSVSYGGLRALADVSITVPEDSFISVIGANGAGKSTLFRTISGATMPSEGSIRFRGADLLACKPSERAELWQPTHLASSTSETSLA